MIDRFDGEFRWLSNFSPHDVEWEGEVYPTVEHAFQAAKTHNPTSRELIRCAPTPSKAKYLGRRVTLREDWDEVRLEIMMRLVVEKFDRHPDLAHKLRATGHQALVEGNTWGDTFWGVYEGNGKNWLGLILMWVRAQLR